MKSRSETTKGYLAVLSASLLWSLGGLFIKLVPWSPLSINAARCAVALVVRTLLRKSVRVAFNRNTVLAALCFCGTTICFSLANKLTTSANAILIQYAYPMILILAFWIYTKKRPSALDTVTSFLILGGIFLCCFDNLASGGMLGNLFALGSGICFALYFFINALPDTVPGDGNYLGFVLGVITGMPFLVRETAFDWRIALSLVVLGAFQLGLAYLLFEYGIRRISAVSASFVTAIEPILNPVWVMLFYGERIGRFAILGGILVVTAAVGHSVLNAKRSQQATS